MGIFGLGRCSERAVELSGGSARDGGARGEGDPEDLAPFEPRSDFSPPSPRPPVSRPSRRERSV
eukprot:5830333-Pyramimonas_sp.AAC.1